MLIWFNNPRRGERRQGMQKKTLALTKAVPEPSSVAHGAIILLAAALLFCLVPSHARAVGGHRPTPPANTEPADSQAFPLRQVEFREFRTDVFHSPDGQPVDVGVVVGQLVDTQVNQSQKFRTVVGNAPAERHGVLTGGITSLVLEVASVGIRFGYTPDGEVNDGSGVRLEGNLTVKVPVITADFKIFDSETGLTYSAVSVDQAGVGVNLSFTVNFDQISIGPEFVAQTPLKDIIRALTANAMVQMLRQRDVNFIPWSTRVLGSDLSRGLVFFDAGVRQYVAAGNLFRAYTACRSTPCFPSLLGEMKVTSSHEYSEAKYKNDPEGVALRGTQPGDKVTISYLPGVLF